MRLIDADALKEYIDSGHLRSPTELCFSELDVVRMLDKQHTVDAEPVRHGRWVHEYYPAVWYGSGEPPEWKCDKCLDIAFNTYDYCPNCGAKMDGGAEDENA